MRQRPRPRLCPRHPVFPPRRSAGLSPSVPPPPRPPSRTVTGPSREPPLWGGLERVAQGGPSWAGPQFSGSREGSGHGVRAVGTSPHGGGPEAGSVGRAGGGDSAAPEPAGEGRVASEDGPDSWEFVRRDRTWGTQQRRPRSPWQARAPRFPWAGAGAPVREGSPGGQGEIGAAQPSAPPSLLVPVPAADWGAGAGTRGCLPPCALRLQGLPQWTRARAAQPSRTVIVPSSSVQGQLGPKPPARDCAPSFSQREAVSSRKNRVSVAGPLAPSAGAWKSGGGRCSRAARSRPPWPAVWRGPSPQPLWASRL